MTHDDDRERDEMRRALAGYRPPPPMPAEAILAAVEQGLARPDPSVIPLTPWRRARPRVAMALAASLVAFVAGTGVGYGVARRGGDDPPPDRQANAERPETPVLYRVTWF
jgi:hypothetical protein